jgi:hypothetical protein
VSDENAIADDWRNFPITRIRFFAGRTLGSLTPNEFKGLQSWLARVREKWDALDEDIKAHYNAIMQRIAHDAGQVRQVKLSVPPKSPPSQTAHSTEAQRTVTGAPPTQLLSTVEAVPVFRPPTTEQPAPFTDDLRAREDVAPAANPKPEEPEPSRAPPKNQSKPRKRDPAYVLQDILGPPQAKFVPGEQNDGEEPEEALAPEALHPALSETCFYGPLGEITNAVAPCTEADPAAILIQLLIAFGNLIGSSPHFWVGSDCHYTNLFACVVGRTSKARKGMSLGYVREGFKIIEPAWISGCLRSGTSSGEGIIWAVVIRSPRMSRLKRKANLPVNTSR